MKSERDGINPAAKPSGTDCVECSAVGGWWLHLRRCVECGHIGCCDTSPNQHASKHNPATDHPIITSFEPGERWFYDYRTGEFFAGPKQDVARKLNGRLEGRQRRNPIIAALVAVRHYLDLIGPAIPDDGARSQTSSSPSGLRHRGASCRNRRHPPRPRPAHAPR
jgi:hypothetical protein